MHPINVVNDFSTPVRKGEMMFRVVKIIDGAEIDISVLSNILHVEQLVLTHRYNPLLYIVDLPLLISYVYGCLNKEDEPITNTFTVYARTLGNMTEHVWFTVSPYGDDEIIQAPIRVEGEISDGLEQSEIPKVSTPPPQDET